MFAVVLLCALTECQQVKHHFETETFALLHSGDDATLLLLSNYTITLSYTGSLFGFRGESVYGVESVCCCVDREDRESRMLSSRMAIVAAFRSWSGEELHSAPTQHLLAFYAVSRST